MQDICNQLRCATAVGDELRTSARYGEVSLMPRIRVRERSTYNLAIGDESIGVTE